MQTLRNFLLEFGIPGFPHVEPARGALPMVSGCTPSAQALWVAREFLAGHSVLVVCSDMRSAEQWTANLEGILGEDDVRLFPGLGIKPFEAKEPFGANLEDRLDVFLRLRSGMPLVVVAPLVAVLMRLPQPGFLDGRCLHFRKGDVCDTDTLRETLVDLGFREQPVVENLGDFSIRGCIVDINPLLSEHPLRLELFGDEIESIRHFDLFSQRSLDTVEQADVFPMGEFRPNPQELQAGLVRMERERGALISSAFAEAIRRGEVPGLCWKRAWFESLHTGLLDYLRDGVVFWDEPDLMPDRVSQIWTTWQEAEQAARGVGDALLNGTEQLLWNWEQLRHSREAKLGLGFTRVRSSSGRYTSIEMRPQERTQAGLDGALGDVTQFHDQGGRVWLLAPNAGQAARLAQLVADSGIEEVLVGHLTEGFWAESVDCAFLTEHQIFNRLTQRVRKRGVSSSAQPVSQLDSLQRGDYVVHRDHGAGRFAGLSRILVDGAHVDCVLLEYAGRDRLTFPVSDLYKIERLNVDEDAPPTLQRLGGKVWENVKARVRRRIVEIAQDLVELYAKRQTVQGFAFPPDSPAQTEFESAFEYEPTPDQVRATAEIKADLQLNRPMDRLVCGDVGFGKTEVAMRVAFKVVHARKQVCVLAPTTILAAQHYETIRSRFAEWPVVVDLVNRYRSTSEKKEIYQRLREGKIDIVVGTHALLSEKVGFQDLGLLLIDEEQKFGVKQKERIRQLRTTVDTLSMSATPIPRTLHLSLTGLRDISLINTPPRSRLPVETRVLRRNDLVIAESVKEELARGGQVFVVHDKVKDIHEVAEQVRAWAPEAKVAVAHGQMNEKDLETVMAAFMNREADILLSTSIIESGLDVPNANTIVILNAHHFGMSQLYQMRGRVGRSNVHALALLVIPAEGSISLDAQKRLDALERFSDLGSGYQLAMKDLEIRGAGNLLGEEQSGFVEEVGFETYVRMVREVVEELQGKAPQVTLQPRVELGIDAFLPEHWIEDGLQRIALYQRLARLEEPAQIDPVRQEMRDRFGPLPEPAENLLLVIECGLWARKYRIQGLQTQRGLLAMTFAENPGPDLRDLGPWQERVGGSMRYLANTPLQAVVELGKGSSRDWAVGALNSLRKMNA
ncbi:MAG TPA: transcription-repair coupling factor [Fibrobacteraceae bacterium]|nr:transcription-repair coupling factor [Fibrobacteraceae bacterium]